ncbi:MAG: glycogen-binding domain-containing protein [Gemmatimonas sp.]
MRRPTFARLAGRAIIVSANAVGGTSACTTMLRAGVVLMTLVAPLNAQWWSRVRGSWDANASVSQFGATAPVQATSPGAVPNLSSASSRWLDQQSMGGALRYNHPNLQFNIDGMVRGGEVVPRVTGGMSATFATPAWRGWRASTRYESRHIPNDFRRDSTMLDIHTGPFVKLPSWNSVATFDISYAHKATGVWIRATRYDGTYKSDSLSRWSFGTGIATQLRSLVIGLGLAARDYHSWYEQSGGIRIDTVTRTVPNDTMPGGVETRTTYDPIPLKGRRIEAPARFADVTTLVAWSGGRFSFDASLSARPKIGSVAASVWGDASMVASITNRFVLVASTRTTPRLPAVPNSLQRYGSLGIRIAPPSLWRPTPLSPIRAVSSAFKVLPKGGGHYMLTLTVPNARTVEIAGDFTAWEPVELKQISSTRWEISLPVAAGSHRCNVRIDGADWLPPPGLPTEKDEFNGHVGLFVVE